MLFAKACEMFILELTLRSWIHTEENKRRTLQRNDIAAAITKTDIFDFLVDIVPRDDLKVRAPKALAHAATLSCLLVALESLVVPSPSIGYPLPLICVYSGCLSPLARLGACLLTVPALLRRTCPRRTDWPWRGRPWRCLARGTRCSTGECMATRNQPPMRKIR